MNQFQVVKDFEQALVDYTGAKYAVTVTSCTMALLLACKWHNRADDGFYWINIPKRTYIGVPQSIIHAGFWPVFEDIDWDGIYQLNPMPIWDSARYFSANMCTDSFIYGGKDIVLTTSFVCVSFHWSKTLAIGQGGAILHSNPDADEWFRKARFDGRTEGVEPRLDNISMVGYHCYMSPRDAADGLSRLAVLPKHNEPLPNDDYPDLSKMEIFQ